MVAVSVIVPTYNRPSYLARALASIQAQTFRDYEIFVVNDAGEDVNRICELFGPVNYITHRENLGLPAARNSGIRRAQGKYIAYLDDDDMWLPRHLEKLVNLRMKSKCRLVYSDSYYWINERDYQVLLSLDFSKEELLSQNLTPICSILHDRELWLEAGKFNPNLPNHEDYDLWLRMSDITPFEHLKEATALYSKRTGSDQMSMDLDFMATNRKAIQQKYLGVDPDRIKKNMKVRVVISFSDAKVGRSFSIGDELQLPEGVDWLKAGFVVPVVETGIEKAVITPTEQRKKTRRGKDVNA